MGYLYVLIFLVLFSFFSFYLYKYAIKTLNFHNFNTEKKSTRIIVLICSILLLGISIIFMSGSELVSILSIFILYTVMFEVFLGIINIFINKYKFWNKIYLSGLLPVILSISMILYGYYNINNIIVTSYDIHFNKNISKDYKAVVIADIHYGITINAEKLKKYVNDINKLNPDFIFLCGDIVDEGTSLSEMREVFNILGRMKNKYGIFYVYGNHDKNIYSTDKYYDVTTLNTTIESNNIIILKDETYTINDEITIIGRDLNDLLNDNNRKSMNDLLEDTDKNDLLIVGDHIPSEYKINKELGIDLIISGHTHGGQLFPIRIIEELFNTADMIYGYKKEGNFHAIVTSGIAGWGYSIRTDSHSEYVIVNIKSN